MARHESPGFMLITGLMVITGLATLVAVNLSRSATELLAATQALNQMQAYHLAEAGMECAINELRWTWTALPRNDATTTATVCSAVGGFPPEWTLTVQVRPQGNTRFVITSIGGTAQAATITVGALVQRSAAPFQHAVYTTLATSDETAFYIWEPAGGSSSVDSFDSLVDGTGEGSIYDATDRGHIRTNSTYNVAAVGQAAVVVESGTVIRGDVYTPPGGEIEDPGGGITGGIGEKPILTFATPDAPPEPGACTELFDLTIDGTSETYPAGTYCANSITVTSGALTFVDLDMLYVRGALELSAAYLALNTTGESMSTVFAKDLDMQGMSYFAPTEEVSLDLYVKEQLHISGASILGPIASPNPYRPQNIRVYGLGDEDWDVGAYGEIMGQVYAPGHNLTIGPTYSAVTGAVISRTCEILGSHARFDEALKEVRDFPVRVTPADVTVEAQY